MTDFLARWWSEFVLVPLRRADADARAAAARGEAGGKTLTVLVAAALLLTLQRYSCLTDEIDSVLGMLRRVGLGGLSGSLAGLRAGHPLAPLAWWAVGTFGLFFVAPALLVRLAFGERLRDYGFKLRGAFADGWVYAALLALVAPLVLLASRDEEFQRTYPFYRFRGTSLGADFWCWEALYALQFVGVEFFFRGFLVHGLKRRLGSYSIPVMTLPYTMIHFGKPLPEALAAVAAGLALGFLSLRTRSIALGAAVHISVALGMDLAALWRRGFFG
jgi:membrane protease YdiL (CAAX protease family)